MAYDTQKHHRRSIRMKGYDYSRAGAYFITICTQDRADLFGEVVDGGMRMNGAGRMIRSVWDEMPAFYPGVDTDEFVVMPNHVHGIVVLVGATPRGRPDSRGRPDAGQARGVAPTLSVPDVGRRFETMATKPCTDASGHTTGSGQPRGVAPTVSVPDVVHRFETMATKPCTDATGHTVRTGQTPGSGQPRGVAPTVSAPDVVHRFKTLTTKRYTDGVKQSGWVPFPGRLWQRNYYEHIIRDDASLDRIRQYIADNPAQWALDRENPAARAPETARAGQTHPAQVRLPAGQAGEGD
jgi:putative transposase